MTRNGFRKLGVFDHDANRFEVAHASTPARSWIELRHLVYDQDIYAEEARMIIPEEIAEKIGASILAAIELPLTFAAVTGIEVDAETLSVLSAVAARDHLGYLVALDQICRSNEAVSTTIGKLARLTLAMSAELDVCIDGLERGNE